MSTESKWYYKFWAYSDIYVDERYQLYVKQIEKIILEDDIDLHKVLYLITHKQGVIEDWEEELRPTENTALMNLYHLSRYAELKRLYDSVAETTE